MLLQKKNLYDKGVLGGGGGGGGGERGGGGADKLPGNWSYMLIMYTVLLLGQDIRR